MVRPEGSGSRAGMEDFVVADLLGDESRNTGREYFEFTLTFLGGFGFVAALSFQYR
jgi:hypothetical protein